jgi:peptidyl-prolyl cis-trans isomerase SurA
MMRIFFTLFLFNVATLISHAQDPATVFTVNKKPVTTDEFTYLYRKNHQNKSEEFTKPKIEEYLDLFINFKLKVTEAQARGIDTTDAFRKEFNTYRDELRKPYLPDSKLLDSLVELTYERMKYEVKASHILIRLPPDASPADTIAAYKKILALREQAVQGEDFSMLAQKNSEDESAKFNKGDLGYFSALQMVYPFESAAYATAVGSVSTPIRTRFGYHIIKVFDKRLSSGEVEISHILIRTGENKDNEKSKNTIFEIYDQLQKGVSWDELCRQYSEDPSSKDNGGKMRPFGRGMMAAVPQFEDAAFALKNPGEVSDPFESQYGWHLIKLERKIPLASFKDVAPTLRNKVSRDDRVQLSKQMLYAKLKKENGFKENELIKQQLFGLADSTLTKGDWKVSYAKTNETLFSVGQMKYSAGDFIKFAKKNQKASRSTPVKYLEQLYNTFADQSLLEAVEKTIADKNPEYKWLLKEYYEGILLFDIMEKEVWNRASLDSIGQQKYFNDHTSNYKAGDRISGKVYSSTTKSHIEALTRALGQKDSSLVSQLVDSLKIRAEAGSFEKSDRQVFNKIEWKPGLYSSENNNLHYVIVVNKILPPGPKTFNEARPEVISDYQNFLEKQWIAQLKKKYPVKVNKKGKEAVIASLVNQEAAVPKK